MTLPHQRRCETAISVLLLLLTWMLYKCEGQYSHTVYVSNGSGCNNTGACCANNSTLSPCCTLSWVAHHCNLENNTEIVFVGMTHTLNETVSFTGYSNIALRGGPTKTSGSDAGSDSVQIECEPRFGLNFIDSRDILLERIEFFHCGSLHNTTSRLNGSVIEASIAVYFEFCLNIHLVSVNVSNSSGIGVAIVASGGDNLINNSGFYYNMPLVNESSVGGGGLQIEFPYCSPREQTTCYHMPYSEYNTGAVYEINNCIFEGNVAYPVNQSNNFQFLPPYIENHVSIGHGGGLGLHFCKANNNRVETRDTTIVSNSAYYGSGISCSFEEYSINNTLVITGTENRTSQIAHNIGLSLNMSANGERWSGAGGGIQILYWFSIQANNSENKVKMSQIKFTGNEAYAGGATLIKASTETTKFEPTNSVSFTDCTWEQNGGYFGGIMLIKPYTESVKTGALLQPTFEGCIFHRNTGNVVVIQLPIAFYRSVEFFGNVNSTITSGVLTVDNSRVEFQENCEANFTENKSHYGGAVTLYGYAFFRVFPNTKFVFEKSYAYREGGAIYQSIVEPEALENGPCFIQYHDRSVPPWEWNTTFIFQSNVENRRTSNPVCNSIVLGSVVPCMWESYLYQKQQKKGELETTICHEWGRVLQFYSDNCSCPINKKQCSNCTQQVYTVPSMLGAKNTSLSVIPGQQATLGLKLEDDLGSDVFFKAVFNVWGQYRTKLRLAPDTLYLTSDSLEMYGTPGTTGILDIDTLPPQPLFISLDITFLQCPPGFVQSQTDFNSTTCQCKNGFNGAVICDDDGRAFLRRGYWIGKLNDKDNDYVVGRTAYIYSKTLAGTFLPSANSSIINTLNEQICGPLHRKGILCSQCKNNYTPRLHGYTLRSCIECDPHDEYGWMLVIFRELAPVTVFLIVVLVFNISATRGSMNFFVFFAQVITNSFSVDAGGFLVQKTTFFYMLSYVYGTLYSFWGLEINLPTERCYTHRIPSPEIFLLVYGQVIYTIGFVLVFLLLARLHYRGVQPFYTCGNWLSVKLRMFRKPWTVQRSVIHALATFLVLSFTKIIEVSLILIAPSSLVNHSGDIVRWVPLYYGEGNGVKYAFCIVTAVVFLVLFVFIPILLLFLLPIRNRLGKPVLEKIFKFIRINPDNTKLQFFLQVFQGSFKDGSGSRGEINCEMFAGIYLLLRLLIFTLAAVFPAPEYILGQQVVVLIAMALFAIYQPYKERLYNVIDVLAFAMLATINSITFYHGVLELMNTKISVLMLSLQYFLVFLPLLAMTVVLSWKTIKYFCGSKVQWKIVGRTRKGTATDEEFLAFVQATRERDRNRVDVAGKAKGSPN